MPPTHPNKTTIHAPNRLPRRTFLAGGAAVAVSISLSANNAAFAGEHPETRVNPIQNVSPSGSKFIEPWIAAHPRDPSQLVILASRYLGKGSGSLHTDPVGWFSYDGGLTWSASEFAAPEQLQGPRSHFGNAHAAFAPDGSAYSVYCGHDSAPRLDLWIFRSDDGGRHWLPPTQIPGDLDYPRLTADLNNGQPRVFVMAGVDGNSPVFGAAKKPGYGCIVLRSDDAAKTFSVANFLAPTTLHHDPINSPILLPDGRLLVGFCDYPTAETVNEPLEQIEHVRIYTTASRDGGTTFSLPAPIGEWLRWDGYMAIAADKSNGPFRGRIYAVGHSHTSHPPGLLLQTSNDGVVWSEPITVPGLPEGPVAYAACAISPSGVLGLAWIHGRPGELVRTNDKNWTARQHDWTMYISLSADGGKTFAKPAALFEKPYRTDPAVPRWPFGAEYLSLASSADGRFHLVWVDTRDGKGVIQTASFEPVM
jgi:hypothetical protein